PWNSLVGSGLLACRRASARRRRDARSSANLRQLIALTPTPGHQVVGLRVADKMLGLRVPLKLPPHLTRNVGQVANADGTMSDLDISQRLLSTPHALQPVLHVIFR